MKIRVFSVFITLLSLFTFVSCDFHNQNVREYLEHWTNSGQIVGHSFENPYQSNSSGITCLPTDSSQTVTLELHNPQKYNLQFEYIFDDLAVKNAAETLTSPVTIDISDDRFSATAVFSRQFLQKIDDESIGDKNISGHITIFEPDSARTFDPYTIALSANSAPPELKNAVCQLSANGSGTYILCFFAPVLTGTVHANDTTHFYYNGTEFTYAASGSITDTQSPSRFSSTAPDPIFPATSGGFEFSSLSTPLGYIPVYFNTGVAFSSDEQLFTITLKDDYGLTSTANVSSKAQQLNPPTFSVASNTSYAAGEETGTYNVTITAPTQCTDDSSCGTGVTLRYTITAGTAVFEGGTSTTLTGTATGSKTIALPKGTYTVRATASKSYFITSSESSVTGVKITQPAIFYVAETGNDDDNTGALNSPYRTIQKALDTFSAGVTSGDYESSGVCEVRVKTNLTPPSDFNWTGNSISFVNVSSSNLSSATIKITGIGSVRTINAQRSGDDQGRVITSSFNGTLILNNINVTGGYYISETSADQAALSTGAGIYIKSAFVMTGGSVSGNTAINGGGIYIPSDCSNDITLTNVEISDNKVTSTGYAVAGGGIYNEGSGQLTLTDVTIKENKADQRNRKDVKGAGIYNDGTLDMTGGSITDGYLFAADISSSGNGYGGALYNSENATLTNVSIKDNITDYGGSTRTYGGAVYNDGDLSLLNVTVSGNTACKGSAIYQKGTLTIDGGCSITDNIAIVNSAESAGIYIDSSASGDFSIKGKNTIYNNKISGTTKQNNVYLPAGKIITVTGSLTGSQIGVNRPFASGSEPTAGNPAAFTSGYGYGTTNTSLPGVIFTAENGYAVTRITGGTDSGEAAFAVSSGEMYLPTDYTFTFVLVDSVGITASDFELGKDNSFVVRPTVTRKNADGTNTTLYHKNTDKKIYTTDELTTLAVEDKADDANYNKVAWSASLYNGSVKVCDITDIQPYSRRNMSITIPSSVTAEDTYTLKVTAKFLGISHDASFTLSGNNAPAGFAQTGTSSGVTFDGTTAITGSQVFISGRTINIPVLYACKHEVTQKEWYDTMGVTQESILSGSWIYVFDDNKPVFNVSWYMAIAYCNKRSIAEGFTPCYTISGVNWNTLSFSDIPTENNDAWNAVTCDFTANGYRLPTEAEWEYLARGGNLTNSGQTDYSGSNDANEVGVFSDLYIHNCGSKKPNALGLYDMSGNVCEWCWDWSSDITSETPETGAPTGTNRINRGGGKGTGNTTIRERRSNTPYSQTYTDGFRVVRTVN